jgi:hypothetical protein
VCDRLATNTVEQVADYFYVIAAEGTFQNLDGARMFVGIAWVTLCQSASGGRSPTPTTTPVPCPTNTQQRGCSWPDGPNPRTTPISPPGDCADGDDCHGGTYTPPRQGAD